MITKTFFQQLSQKFRNENSLSDLTWSLCETIPEFKFKFLNFFFNDITEVAGVELQREYVRGESRPDFYFSYNDKEYIIEVKIQDKNYHFEQYKNAFPDAGFGWIAGYQIEKQDGIEIREWQKLYYELNDWNENEKFDGKDLIIGYLAYLKELFYIIKFQRMELNNSLYYLNLMIEKIISKPMEGCNLTINNQPKSSNHWRSGKYFWMKKNNSETTIIPWFGMFHNADEWGVFVGLDWNWGKHIWNQFDPEEVVSGKYYIKPYIDNDINEICYEMSKDLIEVFNDRNEIQQEEILTNFFNEVINDIMRYL